MAKIPIVLDHFNRGVISEEVLGRVSADWYLHSLKKCDNGIITPYGNIRKRQGTKYIANITGSQFRMVPFVYSETEAYVLLFVMNHGGVSNDNRIYFLTLDGYVVDSSNNPYYIVLTYDNTVDLSKVQYVQKDDIIYLTYKGQPIKKLTRLSENDWTIEDVTLDLKYIIAYGNGTSAIVEGVLPNTLIEPSKIELHYSAGGSDFTVTDDGSGKFSGTNLVNASIDYDTGRIYVKASKYVHETLKVWESNVGYEVGDFCLASNGCVYKATTAGNSGANEPSWVAQIDATVTDNQVTWECVLVPFDSDKPIYVKFLNQDSFYPACVTFFENRLIIGNLPDNPQVISGSVIGSYEEFVFGTNDNNAFVYEIASKENNEIMWLTGGNYLFIGTIGAEYLAMGSSTGITPKSISITKQSEYGCSFIQPVTVGSDILFIQTHRTRMYDFSYQYSTNSYIGSDLTLVNRDILKANVIETAIEKEPYNRIWALLEDGTVALLTYLKSEQIIAWQKYITNGYIKTIATIPSMVDNYSKTYMVVERNGIYYIESTDNPVWNNYFDTVFVDSAITYYGNSTNTISVPYPDGTVVSVLTATGVHKDVTVSNGQVTLDWETTKANIGFSYEYWIETVPIEIISQGQIISVYKPKFLQNIRLYLYNSMGGRIGMDDNYWLLFRTADDLMNNLVPLYSGIKKVDIYDTMRTLNQVYIGIKHKQPIPFNLLAIAVDVDVGQI